MGQAARKFEVVCTLAPPREPGARGRPPKYPWDTLEVGQSFVVPEPKEGEHRAALASLKDIAYYTSNRTGKKFTAHQVPGSEDYMVYRSE